jgi:glycosyltransferase involved in cell wall biosynthesis
MGLEGRAVGIIVASGYGPNVESYRRTRLMLRDAGFTGTILLLGTICNNLQPDWPDVGFEEKPVGFVSDDLKVALLEIADFAPHFVFDGAGTNLKLLDYMGNGVAIIANQFGVRGTEGDDWYWPAETTEELQAALADIAAHPAEARARAERGRAVALATFDWSSIAARFEAGMREGFPLSAAESAEAMKPVEA